MSGPLTEEQRQRMTERSFLRGADDIEAALARLDFLERKVQAADRMAKACHSQVEYGVRDDAIDTTLTAYDEVTE